MPVIPEGFLESLPLNYQHLRVGFHVESVPPDTGQARARAVLRANRMDGRAKPGRCWPRWRRAAATSNTVVIYTADHGENMGEHGLWWKNALYDQAARVPLIVSWPARWPGGQRRVGACSLVDVVRTIAELGGAKAPVGLEWRFPGPLAGAIPRCALEGPRGERILRAQHRFRLRDDPRRANTSMSITPRRTSSIPPQRELYDLQADPGEFHNLAGAPGAEGAHREAARGAGQRNG